MIYPSSLPASWPGEDYSREPEFFKKFKEEFGHDPDWHVYYNLEFVMPDVPTREIDFLVIAPPGIFVIELKNGKYRVDENGEWFRRQRSSGRSGQGKTGEDWETLNGKNHRSPLRQAETALNNLLNFLETRHHFRLPAARQSFGYLCLLLQNMESDFESIGPGKKNILAGDVLKRHRLRTHLERAARELSLREPEKKVRETLGKSLENNFNFLEDVSTRKRAQRRRLLSLTREQYAGLEEIRTDGEGTTRLLLRGVAGSGKTLLALEAARRASSAGLKTLLLCHSSNLNSWLERKCDGLPGVRVARMAGLCREIIQEFDPDFGQRGREKKREGPRLSEQEFLRNVLPEKTLEYAGDSALAGSFQFLIVDEAQDILSENEMLILDSLLAGGMESGHWMVCFDPRQALSGGVESGLNFLRSFQPVERGLSHNIRTPAKIFELACRLAGHPGEGRLPDISDPHFVRYDKPEGGRDKLTETIEYILEHYHLEPEEILILSPVNKKHTEALGSARKLSDRVKIKLVEDGVPRPGEVGFAEIRRFKGLEIPCVILTGFDDFGDRQLWNQLFVGLTRATSLGFLLYPGRAETSLRKVLREGN